MEINLKNFFSILQKFSRQFLKIFFSLEKFENEKFKNLTGKINPKIGPKRAPTRSKIAAILVLNKVKMNNVVNKMARVIKIFFESSSPFFFLIKKLKVFNFSKISMIVMILKGTENRGFRATRNFNL